MDYFLKLAEMQWDSGEASLESAEPAEDSGVRRRPDPRSLYQRVRTPFCLLYFVFRDCYFVTPEPFFCTPMLYFGL